MLFELAMKVEVVEEFPLLPVARCSAPFIGGNVGSSGSGVPTVWSVNMEHLGVAGFANTSMAAVSVARYLWGTFEYYLRPLVNDLEFFYVLGVKEDHRHQAANTPVTERIAPSTPT